MYIIAVWLLKPSHEVLSQRPFSSAKIILSSFNYFRMYRVILQEITMINLRAEQWSLTQEDTLWYSYYRLLFSLFRAGPSLWKFRKSIHSNEKTLRSLDLKYISVKKGGLSSLRNRDSWRRLCARPLLKFRFMCMSDLLKSFDHPWNYLRDISRK